MTRTTAKPTINPYEVFGLTRQATSAEIRSSFKRLVLRAHPDKNPDRPEWSQQRVKDLVTAFELIGEPEKRRSYDLALESDYGFA